MGDNMLLEVGEVDSSSGSSGGSIPGLWFLDLN